MSSVNDRQQLIPASCETLIRQFVDGLKAASFMRASDVQLVMKQVTAAVRRSMNCLF